jgi:acetate kinase
VSTLPGQTVLALNAGSSSLKYGLYRVTPGAAEKLLDGAEATAGSGGNPVARIAAALAARGQPPPTAIGHRIVHGGLHCRRHTVIDAQVLRQLEAAAVFAPIHVPPALALIAEARTAFPSAPQVACLDTTFHADMPDVARILPLPAELRAIGVERYGFHGLSCESIVRQLSPRLPARLVIAHLGHGASVTAVAQGRSLDTTMGLTPSGGIMMSTRTGDIDPGVLIYLVRERAFGAADLETLIDARSGLQGVSGLSGDMRALWAAAASNPAARLAIDMFCYSVRKSIAAMAAVLGGIDLLVFTGGIGEHDAASRALICAGLEPLGIRNDAEHIRVLGTREEEQIALHTEALIV